MEDPGKVIVAIVAIVAIATTVRTVVMSAVAAVQRRRDVGGDSTAGSLADARLSRLEQAVDAIALEIERISEGQRFTTKLLSEQARRAENASRQLSSSNTPT